LREPAKSINPGWECACLRSPARVWHYASAAPKFGRTLCGSVQEVANMIADECKAANEHGRNAGLSLDGAPDSAARELRHRHHDIDSRTLTFNGAELCANALRTSDTDIARQRHGNPGGKKVDVTSERCRAGRAWRGKNTRKKRLWLFCAPWAASRNT